MNKTVDDLTNEQRLVFRGHYRREPVQPVPLEVGQRVKFAGNRRWWTVRATTDSTVVLTRQEAFQLKGVLCYTVIDWNAGVRGPTNEIGQGWGDGTFSDQECQDLADAVASPDDFHEVSHRNWVTIRFTAGVER
jgi:hypothetical protein